MHTRFLKGLKERTKRWLYLVLAGMVICCLTACDGDVSVNNGESADGTESREGYRNHQTLTAGRFSFDANSDLRVDIPEVGLKNVFIRTVSDTAKLDTDTYGRVYLLADDRYGGGMSTSDHYLAVVLNHSSAVVVDLAKWDNQSCMSGTVTLCDLDGDGDSEIVLQETIGASGGAGQYLSRVFDFANGLLTELFTSMEDETDHFDTGFFATILPDCQLKVENRHTGYAKTVTVTGKDADYFRFWYDEEGIPLESVGLLVDSFYHFVPEDVDDDGVYELRCCQYTSLIDHSDYVGTAISILKFDATTNSFVIVDADFEQKE